MSRSNGLASAALAALLVATASASAQTPVRGELCAPAVPDPGMYGQCRIAVAGAGAVCRCEVRPQAVRQPVVRSVGVQNAGRAVNSTPRIAATDAAAPDGFLGPADLRQMYSGRTWMWADGGGYFDPSGAFHAAVGDTATTAFLGRGTWTAGPQGALCFSALWNGQVGQNDERTCFYHKAEGGKILQRKGGTGEWYTFRSAPGKPGDAFNELVQGNRIAAKTSDLRARLLYGVQM